MVVTDRVLCGGVDALVAVIEAAVTAGADGVHMPEDAPTAVRPRPGFLVGRSVHSLEAARRAGAEGVDYLIAGPVYETRSHPGVAPAGVPLIEESARAGRVPVRARGGGRAGAGGGVSGEAPADKRDGGGGGGPRRPPPPGGPSST